MKNDNPGISIDLLPDWQAEVARPSQDQDIVANTMKQRERPEKAISRLDDVYLTSKIHSGRIP